MVVLSVFALMEKEIKKTKIFRGRNCKWRTKGEL